MAFCLFMLCFITGPRLVITKAAEGNHQSENTTESGNSKYEFGWDDAELRNNITFLYGGEGLEFERQAVSFQYLWPNNTFYYKISNQYSDEDFTLIRKAIDRLAQEVSCLKFVDWRTLPRSGRKKIHRAYISDGADGQCDAHVAYRGLRPGAPQAINLGKGCLRTGMIGPAEHEIMHALGVRHQHQRGDRDEHIDIYWDKINSDMMHNFEKDDYNTHGLPYDVSSVMHYSNDAFSESPWTLFGLGDSMSYKNGKNVCLGQGNKASDCDLELLRHMYNCPLKNNCRSDTLKYNYKKRTWWTLFFGATCDYLWFA